MTEEIKNKQKELKAQLEVLKNEELRLEGLYGNCVVCGEEKRLNNQYEKTCYGCKDEERKRDAKEYYEEFIGKKIIAIYAEPRYLKSSAPDIYCIEIEGGYEIKVEAWSDPLGMSIEKS